MQYILTINVRLQTSTQRWDRSNTQTRRLPITSLALLQWACRANTGVH